MFQIVPNDIDLNFVGKRKAFGMGSLIVCLLCIAAVVFIGPNYGIDFKGGSDVILKFNGSATSDEVRTAAKTVFPDANVQRFGEEEKNEFLIQTQQVSVVNAQTIDEKVRPILEPLGEIDRVTWSPEQPDRLDVIYKVAVDAGAITDAIKSVGLEGVETVQQGVEGEPATWYVSRTSDRRSGLVSPKRWERSSTR